MISFSGCVKVVFFLFVIFYADFAYADASRSDVNNDGVVDDADLEYYEECINIDLTKNLQCENADVNGDGSIDDYDEGYIKYYLGESGFSYSSPPEEGAIIYGQGAPFPVNEVIISFKGYNDMRSVAEDVAASVNGEVVGVVPSVGLYQIRMQTKTVEELDATIELLSADVRVSRVSRNVVAIQF